MINCYEVLGLAPTASQEEIKAAYRRLVHKYHPDRNNGDRASAQRFIAVKEAYDLLSDPVAKSKFDRDLREYYEKMYSNYNSQSTSTSSNSSTSMGAKTTSKEDTYTEGQKKSYQASPPPKPNIDTSDATGCLIIFLIIVLGFIAFKGCNNDTPSGSSSHTNSELHDEFVTSKSVDTSYEKEQRSENLSDYRVYQPIEEYIPQSVKDSIRYVEQGYQAMKVKNGKKPDCYNYSPEYDYSMDNKLIVHVGGGTDVVIKVMDYENDLCIKYFYINSGTTYTVRNFPEGRYYLKIAYGKTWMSNVESEQCKGKFLHNESYEKGSDILDFRKEEYADYVSFPSYELKLDMVITGRHNSFNTDEINSDEFNR